MKGTTGWQTIRESYLTPSTASHVRLCVLIQESNTGHLWVKNLGVLSLSRPETEERPNVLFLLIDTLRADMLGVHGHRGHLTPVMDQLSSESFTYERSWSQYTWTVPSYVSYMTSRYANSHGWRYSMERALEEGLTLSDAVPTLAQVLRDSGYLTVGVVNNTYLKTHLAMDRGFDIWSHPMVDSLAVDLAIRDIEHWGADENPNFLYVHLMPTHAPICTSEEAQATAGVDIPSAYVISPTEMCPEGGVWYRKYYEDVDVLEHNEVYQQAYRTGVREADLLIGRVLQALDDQGERDNTIVVVTSDHGEILGEHDDHFGHGNYIYEGLTWVPLMVRAPSLEPQTVEGRVGELIDIAPTVLDLVGLGDRTPTGWQGEVMYRAQGSDLAASERSNLMAFTNDGSLKIVENRWNGSLRWVFELETDPGEQHSVDANPTAAAMALREAATQWRLRFPAGAAEGEALELDEEEQAEALENLRALGYVE